MSVLIQTLENNKVVSYFYGLQEIGFDETSGKMPFYYGTTLKSYFVDFIINISDPNWVLWKLQSCFFKTVNPFEILLPDANKSLTTV